MTRLHSHRRIGSAGSLALSGLVALAALAALLPSLSAASANDARANLPNIIVIVSDDQGYADAGFQGSKEVATPHLDALAGDGVRCTRGYVTAPVCSPSRAGLMTGRYQERFGHHNNLTGPEAERPDAHLPFTETLLPQVLANAGYQTAMIGKWHLGFQDGARPYERGFQDFFGIITGGHDYFINNPGQRPVRDEDYKARIERNGVGEKVEKYLTDAFGDEAVRVVKENKNRPFFLYLAFNAPHTPTQAKRADIDAIPASVTDQKRRAYIAQIVSMDAAIGRLRAALKETGAEKNTFIVFFSDNGGANHPYYDNTPLHGAKGTTYEGGVRVPFLACYPGRIPAGSVCDVPVTSLDVFATACALAGAKPENEAQLDSRDMLPVLTGASSKATHDALYWEYYANLAVADGDIKLVIMQNGAPELYDLSKDIGEKRNLAAERPQDVARLQGMLKKWRSGNVRPLWGGGPGKAASASPATAK